MKNFLQFIWKNQFTFLFFLLEIIGFSLLSANNGYHQSRFHSTAVAITGWAADLTQSVEKYIGLIEENQRLQAENLRLRSTLLTKNALPSSEHRVAMAMVIHNTYTRGNNVIIINKGALDGVAPQQGVESPDGVVGIVRRVSAHYSSVMPLIHSQSMVSCKLAGSEYFGILKWNGKSHNEALLEDIPNHVGVNSGDSVLTRGSSGTFPPNRYVGMVIASERNESTGFQSIKVRLAADFRRLNSVYIFANPAREEIQELLNDPSE